VLSIAVALANILLIRDALAENRQDTGYPIIAEAREIATAMAPHVKSREAPRMLLQFKYWNFDALAVFLNRYDAIVRDREISRDPSRDNPSLLLGSRELVLAQLRPRGVRFIAVWTPEIQAHIEPWGLERITKVGSYTIYRVPFDR